MPEPATAACPACEGGPLSEVERHRDPIGGREYRLSSCAACGVVSSEPREAVGADWYEKSGPIRGREVRPDPAADWRFRQFLQDRVPAGRLLDVGCGDGGFLGLARDAGFSPTGFDYDERVASQAKAAGLDAHALEFSAFCRSREAGEFATITLFDVLEHAPEPARFLAELKRLLAPGGHLAVTLPNALRPLPFGREAHDFPPHHFTRWSPESLRGFLARQGFSIVRQESGRLRLRHLADHAFFYRVMPLVLAPVKRLLFGGKAAAGASVTELYEKSGGEGVLGDKLRRQRLVEAARAAFGAVFLPVAAAMSLYYKARRPDCGDILYTLAKRRG